MWILGLKGLKQNDGLSPPYFILTKPNENDHLQRKVKDTFLFLNSPFTANVYIKITEHHERKKFMTRKLNRIREGTRSNWMISECLDSDNTTRDRKLQKNNKAISLKLLGGFSKGVFERRTLIGSVFFSPLIFLDAITFVLLSVFTPTQITCPKVKQNSPHVRKS